MQSAVEFKVSSMLYRCCINMCMLNGKMDFASHEDEVMDEEINDQHKEMSDQEMSDEDYALLNNSYFGNNMER